jgi:hypothetical protein
VLWLLTQCECRHRRLVLSYMSQLFLELECCCVAEVGVFHALHADLGTARHAHGRGVEMLSSSYGYLTWMSTLLPGAQQRGNLPSLVWGRCQSSVILGLTCC